MAYTEYESNSHSRHSSNITKTGRYAENVDRCSFYFRPHRYTVNPPGAPSSFPRVFCQILLNILFLLLCPAVYYLKYCRYSITSGNLLLEPRMRRMGAS